MMREFDSLIIGAGVIGCAVAHRLTTQFPSQSIAVLEKEPLPGQHTSGRNSGVIHSGFNPKPGTLKAQLCVDGNKQLKEFCRDNEIPFDEVGTLVVATDQKEISVLEELLKRGQANGVPGIHIIDQKELKAREPNSLGIAALHSPSAAITSGKMVTKKLAEQAKARGAQFFFEQKVIDIQPVGEKIKIITTTETFLCRFLINCSGLYADKIAHYMDIRPDLTIIPFRGEYFKVRPEKSTIIKSMIYPVPDLQYPFLGVHWTKTIDGDVIIGPNATMAWSRESYSPFRFNTAEFAQMISSAPFWKMFSSGEFRKMAWTQLQISLSKKKFVEEARKLVPNIEESDFVKGKSGNRPQLIGKKGELIDDILVEKKGNSLHVLNAVSPGFTCSLAFAEHLVQQLFN